MGIFGWDLPPGCSQADVDAAMGVDYEGTCKVCAGLIDFPEERDGCICPECEECGEWGDPICYEEHGLVKSEEQIEQYENLTAKWEEQDRTEALWLI